MRQECTPTYYCSKHERLLGWKYKEWIDFSLETITRIKALYEFFLSAHINTFAKNGDAAGGLNKKQGG